MAVVATNLLVGGSSSAGSSFTTASVTLPANKLILLVIALDNGGTPAPTITPTLSGVTFTQVAQVNDPGGTRSIALFRAMPTSFVTGQITITLSASNGGGINWTVDSFNNVDITGSNGANAIVQSATNSLSDSGSTVSMTVTLGAFANSNNATYGAIGINANFTISAGAGFTQLAQANNTSSIQSQFEATNNTSVSWSWSPHAVPYGVAVEIKFVQQSNDDMLIQEV